MVTSVYQERNFGISESVGQSKETCEEAAVGVWIAFSGSRTRPRAVGVERSGEVWEIFSRYSSQNH